MNILGKNAGFRLWPYFVNTLHEGSLIIEDCEKIYAEEFSKLPSNVHIFF